MSELTVQRELPTAQVAVSVMRQEGLLLGYNEDELRAGNVIPRLCHYAGETACAQVCQKPQEEATTVLCAEDNIAAILKEQGVEPENFVMVAATEDNVGFYDTAEPGLKRSPFGYRQQPACNAFFARKNEGTAFGMRMADCGAVVYEFKDRDGEDVVGLAHFSRTNMRGPSAYKHEADGDKVSWQENIMRQAVEHYGAQMDSMRISLIAAVEGKDFIHRYETLEEMERHFPGWDGLGFMHPATRNGELMRDEEGKFDTLINYREMIRWQLLDSIQTPELRIVPEQFSDEDCINTGDITTGHSSHHWATKGIIAHGRDLYLVSPR